MNKSNIGKKETGETKGIEDCPDNWSDCPDRNTYRCFNVIACTIYVEEFHNATQFTLSSCRHRFQGSAATRMQRAMNRFFDMV